MRAKEYSFRTKVWRYQGPAGWYFASLPKTTASRIRKNQGDLERGWGRLKVQATVGKTSWNTSIWFDSKLNTYLLPIKAEIREREWIIESNYLRMKVEIIPG